MTPVDSARETIQGAVREFAPSLAVLTSLQREGVVIIDLVQQIAPGTPVMTIDTGRLPNATLRIMEQIESRYGIAVERLRPEPAEVSAMTAAYGADLFRDSVPQRMLCCNIRKVRPLARRLETVAAYFTGLRRSQSASRAGVEVFDRTSRAVKISPLAAWEAEDVAQYTLEHDLPLHALYEQGYTSIGCDPCTRAVRAGEHERAGRWWWETDADRECGLHFSADGKAERHVDVLLRDVLASAAAH